MEEMKKQEQKEREREQMEEEKKQEQKEQQEVRERERMEEKKKQEQKEREQMEEMKRQEQKEREQMEEKKKQEREEQEKKELQEKEKQRIQQEQEKVSSMDPIDDKTKKDKIKQLLEAIKKQTFDEVKQLLLSDPLFAHPLVLNGRGSQFMEDAWDNTPLMFAAREGKESVGRELLLLGADPTIMSLNMVPLHIATLHGYVALTRAILKSERGKDIVNTPSTREDRQTPFHWACKEMSGKDKSQII